MIYESGIADHDGLRYRVQMRRCLDGSYQQRHIWYKTLGEDIDPPQVDPWIASLRYRSPEAAFRNMIPNPEIRDEIEELIAALQEIAAGHNDPRHRAASALEAANIRTA